MQLREHLEEFCRRRDGGPYPAYRDLRGRWALDGVDLEILRVQGDPFASPSKARLWIPWSQTSLNPADGTRLGAQGCRQMGRIDVESARAVAVRDFLGRTVGAWLEKHSPRQTNGRSLARMMPHGQEILDRTAVLLHEDAVEVRLTLDLPARGRRILGRLAHELLIDFPEDLVARVFADGVRLDALERHVAACEDFAFLQSRLEDEGWIGFVADGSSLARRAGNDERPLLGEDVVLFESPISMRQTVELPHAGPTTGMALEPGVTLLCGGGFHGKSTLLRALSSAIVPHVPGDGRERVAVRPDAQSVRAEDGRAIHEMDLRPFLRDLPLGRSTGSLTTENASGSTSQAAAILEAMQAGSRFLLIDEDTSATNFMIRDPLMERLLARDREPIQPLLHQARTLFEKLGVSLVLVVGGSGEYFRVADRVLVLDTYRPIDETHRAREIARERDPLNPDDTEAGRFREAMETARSFSSGPKANGPRGSRVKALAPDRITVERVEVQLHGMESLRDIASSRFLSRIVSWRQRELSGTRSGEMRDVLALKGAVEAEWSRAGLDGFGPEPAVDVAAVRWLEVAGTFDRLRSRPAPRVDWGLEPE